MPGKKIYGRKRHVLVDTQGLLLAVKVHTAGLADCLGAPLLLKGLRARFPRISHLFADQGYRGLLRNWIMEELGWTVEIVPGLTNTTQAEGKWVWINARPVWRPAPRPKAGFQVQRKRWIVERTLAWLTRFRRLSRDYEGLPSSSEALIQLASIRLMLSRLAPFRY
jgi:putative transposase